MPQLFTDFAAFAFLGRGEKCVIFSNVVNALLNAPF